MRSQHEARSLVPARRHGMAGLGPAVVDLLARRLTRCASTSPARLARAFFRPLAPCQTTGRGRGFDGGTGEAGQSRGDKTLSRMPGRNPSRPSAQHRHQRTPAMPTEYLTHHEIPAGRIERVAVSIGDLLPGMGPSDQAGDHEPSMVPMGDRRHPTGPRGGRGRTGSRPALGSRPAGPQGHARATRPKGPSGAAWSQGRSRLGRSAWISLEVTGPGPAGHPR